MDNDADAETGRLCYVGVDNREAGRAVGRLVKKALPRTGGMIAMFIGSDDLGQRQGPHRGRARRTGHPRGQRHPRHPHATARSPAGRCTASTSWWTARRRPTAGRRRTRSSTRSPCSSGWRRRAGRVHDRAVRVQPAGHPVGGQGQVAGRQGEDRRVRREPGDAAGGRGRRDRRDGRAGPVQLRVQVGRDPGRRGPRGQVEGGWSTPSDAVPGGDARTAARTRPSTG